MQYRDLSIIPIAEEYMVVACDSAAAIGEKEHDMINVPAEVTGAHCIRVPLLELLSIGAEPFLVINLSGNEMKPTGEKYLKGIQSELDKAGYSNMPINGSTEENISTTMSSIGITVLGKARHQQLKWKAVQRGDVVFQIGRPYVGEALLNHFDVIVSYDDIKALLEFGDAISEIVPVGSKGSWNEAMQLAQVNQLTFQPIADNRIEAMCQQSAGPSTTVIVAGERKLQCKLEETFENVFIIGEMVREDE